MFGEAFMHKGGEGVGDGCKTEPVFFYERWAFMSLVSPCTGDRVWGCNGSEAERVQIGCGRFGS